jgi:hypothetical protein
MKCFSVLVGAHGTRAAGRTFSSADDQLIQRITARHFRQGFTILEASGGWFDPEKQRFVQESSRQIIITAGSRRDLRQWLADLAHALGQKELILIEVGPAYRFRFPGAGAPRRGAGSGSQRVATPARWR